MKIKFKNTVCPCAGSYKGHASLPWERHQPLQETMSGCACANLATSYNMTDPALPHARVFFLLDRTFDIGSFLLVK